MTNIRAQFSNFILLLASILLCFLAGEVFVRVFFGEEVLKEKLSKRISDNSGVRTMIRPSLNPDVFYELKPEMETAFLGKEVKTNAHGFRISNQPKRIEFKGNEEIVIVGIGDSTMFGWGVNYNETYLNRLENLLNSKKGNKNFIIKNLSVPGYNSEQELATLKVKALSTKPKIILLHYDHNDPDPIGIDYKPDYMAPEVGDNIIHSALIKWVVRRLTYRQNKNRIYVQGNHKRFQDYLFEGPAYDKHLLALKEFGRVARNNDIPVFIIVFDTWIKQFENKSYDSHYKVFHSRLIPFLQEQGFQVLDLYEVFQAYMKDEGLRNLKSLWLSPSDGHPGPEGHKIIANALYRLIRTHGRTQEMIKEQP